MLCSVVIFLKWSTWHYHIKLFTERLGEGWAVAAESNTEHQHKVNLGNTKKGKQSKKCKNQGESNIGQTPTFLFFK